MRRVTSRNHLIAALAASALASGCVLAPPGTKAERQRADAAGAAYEIPVEARVAPELPIEPSWRDLLQRAFLTNGDLEAAYHDWRAALARIDVAAAYPNTNVSLNFSYMFSPANMKAWDRTTLNLGFDPMQNLSFPTKVVAAGRVALDEARAAGERFAAAKFALQERVLKTYLDYALLAEKIRIYRADLGLADIRAESATARVQSGGRQKELLQAEVERELARNELHNAEAEVPQVRAALNALLGRDPAAPFALPKSLPAPRPIPDGDGELLAIGVAANPELAALAHDVRGRRDALELARQRYIPDINPFAGITGDVSQIAGAAISIPATIPAIRGTIAESRAMLRGAEAKLAQAKVDRGAAFVAAVYALRNSEREADFLQDQVLPLSRRAAENAQELYTTGTDELGPVIDGERLLLDTELMIAEARIAREKYLAELETLAAVDVETLRPGASAATADLSRQQARADGAGETR